MKINFIMKSLVCKKQLKKRNIVLNKVFIDFYLHLFNLKCIKHLLWKQDKQLSHLKDQYFPTLI